MVNKDKIKKILIVTSSFPLNEKDNSGIFVLNLCRHLRKLGVEVDILAPEFNGERCKDRVGFKIFSFRYFFKWGEKLNPPGGGAVSSIKKKPFLIFVLPFYYFALTKHTLGLSKKYDRIIVFWFWNAIFLHFFKRIKSKTSIVTLGSDFLFFSRNFFLRYWYKKVLKKFKNVITDNPYNKDLIPFSKRIYMGIDLSKITHHPFQDELSNPYIVFCGSLTKNKGILDLVAAFSKLTNYNYPLVVIGDGPLKKKLIRKIDILNLFNRVFILGKLPHDQVLFLIQNAKLLVLPSYSEGTPNVILEAISLNTPFIAYDIPQIASLLNRKKELFLVKKGDIGGLKTKIEELMLNDEKIVYMKSVESDWIKEQPISWERTAKEYLKAL